MEPNIEMNDDEIQMLLHDERSSIFETRVERASMCRDRGNEQFKTNEINEAIKWYDRSLYHVDFDEATWHFEFVDKHRSVVNEIRLPVHLNLAACYLSENYVPSENAPKDEYIEKVISHSKSALEIDPQNVKALYRYGKASLLSGDLNKANELLRKAAALKPSDKNIRDTIMHTKEKLNQAKQVEKATWGGRLLSDPIENNKQNLNTADHTKEEIEKAINATPLDIPFPPFWKSTSFFVLLSSIIIFGVVKLM